MKALFSLLSVCLIVAIVFNSCQKDPGQAAPAVPSNDKAVDCIPCNGTPTPTTPPPAAPPMTDAQYLAMGTAVGCNLAKIKRSDVYQNTLSLGGKLPAAYLEGIRTGWMNCYSNGPIISQPPVTASGGNFCVPVTALGIWQGGGVTVVITQSQTVCSSGNIE